MPVAKPAHRLSECQGSVKITMLQHIYHKNSEEMTHFVAFWADFLDYAAEPRTHCQGVEVGSLGDTVLASIPAAVRTAPASEALEELCRVRLGGCLAAPAGLGQEWTKNPHNCWQGVHRSLLLVVVHAAEIAMVSKEVLFI